MAFERVVQARKTSYGPDGNEIDEGLGNLKTVEGGHIHTEPAVDIFWSREHGHIQLSMELPREQWFAIADELRTEPWEDVAARAVFTQTLSRHEVNAMIRVLRRARNAAFGADE